MVQKLIAMSAIAAVAVAAILMLGTLAAISMFNHASAQESSNTGNATEGANNPEPLQEIVINATEGASNPEPLQEMVPAMTFTPFHITTKQLSNGLTEEKPAASTNKHCQETQAQASGGSLLCLPNSSSLARAVSGSGARVAGPVTAEHFGIKGFIIMAGGKSTGLECPSMTPQTVRFLNGVEYTICETEKPYVPPPEATKPEQIPGGAHIPLCPQNKPVC